MLTAEDVSASARVVGLELNGVEAAEALHYLQGLLAAGERLLDALATDVLATEDPRWDLA